MIFRKINKCESIAMQTLLNLVLRKGKLDFKRKKLDTATV